MPLEEKTRIYLSSPHMSEEGYELKYIQEAFATNWVAPLGPNVDKFEEELAQLVGSKGAVALSSGTAAIHLALKAAGVGKGDYVLCQDLTFAATANPIIYEGAIPVFVDSDRETWNICPEALNEAIKRYPNAKAVLIVHLYGLSADMDAIKGITDRHGLQLIEDAAESLGTLYKGKYTGTIGDYGIYSFNGNKIITSSGGGMLVSDDREKLNKVKFWATQARDKAPHYQHSELGFNYRMSNVLAGIGRGQLKVLAKRIEKKKYIFDYYKNELDSLTDLTFMPMNNWNDPNFWLTCLTIKDGPRPLAVIEALEAENIESRPIWKPMHLQPFYEKYPFIETGVSQKLFAEGLCLPSDTKMTPLDLARVCQTVKNFWL